jgi:hypothetical protein
MMTVELLVLAGIAAAAGMLMLASRFGRRDDGSDPAVEHADWRRVDAEVISMLRVGDRTFLRVRFSVGSSLVQNDVLYPLAGAAPHAGRRVPVRYDPAAPMRVAFDLHPGSRTPLEPGRRATRVS